MGAAVAPRPAVSADTDKEWPRLFKDLPEEVQEKAVQKWGYNNPEYDWWDDVYEFFCEKMIDVGIDARPIRSDRKIPVRTPTGRHKTKAGKPLYETKVYWNPDIEFSGDRGWESKFGGRVQETLVFLRAMQKAYPHRFPGQFAMQMALLGENPKKEDMPQHWLEFDNVFYLSWGRRDFPSDGPEFDECLGNDENTMNEVLVALGFQGTQDKDWNVFLDYCQAFIDAQRDVLTDMLRKEYDWLTSEEYARETIEANEYRFDEDGDIA